MIVARLVLLLLFGLLTSLAPTVAQAVARPDFQTLEAELESLMETHESYGLGVAITTPDGVVWSRVYGVADTATGRPVQADTPFRVGSISKSLTALIAMQLVDEGYFSWDTPLREIAPEIALTNTWEDTDPVRIIHLVEHTTGWDDLHPHDFRHRDTLPTTLEALQENPRVRISRWRPGRFPSYSNMGPAVLAYILEKVTGEPFETLAETRIFTPLGLANSTFDQSPDAFARLAQSHVDGEILPAARIFAAGSGAAAMSADDLGRLAQFYLNRGQVSGQSLIAETEMRAAERPRSPLSARLGMDAGYGLGLVPIDHNGALFFGHDGGIDASVAEFGYRADGQVGFAITTSGGDIYGPAKSALLDFIARAYPDSSPAPVPEVVELDQYAGLYRHAAARMAILQPITEMTEVLEIEAEDGHLRLIADDGDLEVRLHPSGDHQFRVDSNLRPHILFAELDNALYLLGGLDATYVRVSEFDAYAPVYLFLLLTLLTLSLAGRGLVRLVTIGGQNARSKYRLFWVWPTLGVISFVLLSAGPVIALAMVEPQTAQSPFAGIDPLSGAIYLASLILPASAVIGLIYSVMANDRSLLSRAHAALISVPLLLYSAWLWPRGWIGLKLWAFTPSVLGL